MSLNLFGFVTMRLDFVLCVISMFPVTGSVCTSLESLSDNIYGTVLSEVFDSLSLTTLSSLSCGGSGTRVTNGNGNSCLFVE